MENIKANIAPEMFEDLVQDPSKKQEIVRPSISYWQDAFRRFKKNKASVVAIIFIIILIFAAIFAPFLTPYDYFDQNLDRANELPSSEHIFGLDNFGRDIFTRVLYGARISLTVGFAAAFFTIFIGILYGGISAFIGGTTDIVMMRILEILSGVPNLLVLILLMVVLGPGMTSIILAMGLTSWIGMARMVRGEVLRLREQEFVLAARVMGISNKNILIRHLIPNAIGSILVNLTFTIPSAIFNEAFLSYLGLGVSAPMASWGVLSSDAVETFTSYPLQLVFPSLAIMLTVLSFNYLGDGLRDSLDPKMRK